MRLCSRCKTPKDLSSFGRRADAADGLNPRCKPCNVEVALASRARHPETSRTWEVDNRARRREQKAAYMRRARAKQEAS